VKSTFGFRKDENVVSPPEINEDPFDPNYVGFEDKTPEEVYDIVESIDFPGTFVHLLQSLFFID